LRRRWIIEGAGAARYGGLRVLAALKAEAVRGLDDGGRGAFAAGAQDVVGVEIASSLCSSQ
jgi:hypothetical protein